MKEKYVIHLTYDEDLNLSCLNNVLDAISKGFNDINREFGKKGNNEINKYNPVISGIREGSLIIDLIVSFVVSVGGGIVSNYIYNRLSKLKEKKIEVELTCKENNDGSKEIKLHITKSE